MAQPGQIAPGVTPQNRARGAEEQSKFSRIASVAQQAFLGWALIQLATRFFTPSPAPAVTHDGSPNAAAVNPLHLPPIQVSPAWSLNQPLDLHVYFVAAGDVTSNRYALKDEEKLPSFVWRNITFGDWKETRTEVLEITVPEIVKRNGTLWAEMFLTKNGASPDFSDPDFDPKSIHHVRKLLTPYLPKPKIRKEKMLLSSSEESGAVEEEEPMDVVVPHWNTNITLALVSDEAVVPYDKLPPVLLEHIHLVQGERDETGTKGFYKPILFANEFWHLRSQYTEINMTTTTLPLRIVFQPMSYTKFQIFTSMTHGFNEAAKQQGASAGAELDEIKRMLLETNPWFLGLTGLVSMLHVVFEMLAFKSDVSHWRQRKELVGVSVRTIITNVFVQVVVLLYLIDNNSETSWMILFGSGTGVLIEAWKITKAVKISIVASPTGSLLPYKLSIEDKHELSEDEKKTQEYDKLAFRYVSYVAIPTLAGYTVYSLLYNTHKGWYSFVISTLTSFVYMFGFAQLVPQLIINHKLKSVAHMPMKAMIYKTLSTVVDDFFAFCIKMPFLHRLACFRDDLVFLVFLYQRWIYRVDPKRVNEYGQVLAEDAIAADASGESKKTK